MNLMLLGYFLTVESVYEEFISLIRTMRFASEEWAAIKWVVDFRAQYSRLPTWEELQVKFSVFPIKVYLDLLYVRKEILSFIRQEKLREWIINVAEGIDRGNVDYGKVFDELRKLKESLEDRQKEGRMYDLEYKNVIDGIVTPEVHDRVRSGITRLDTALQGGFGVGELSIMVAPPGAGKTVFLINCMFNAMMRRNNVLFLSCELGAEKILERLYRRIGMLSRKDIRLKGKEEVEVLVQRFIALTKSVGEVIFKKPESWGVNELRSYIERRQLYDNVKYDMVCVDYLDKMKKGRGEFRLALRDLAEDLRYMAIEQGVAVVTASQAGRGHLESTVVLKENIAESWGKVEVADVVLTLSRNKQEEEKSQARISVQKNREFAAGALIPVTADMDKMYLGDLLV